MRDMGEKDIEMKFDITPDLLKKIAGGSVNSKVVEGLSKYLPQILEEYDINTKLRVAHFLAQIAHESDHFRTLEEYASGSSYEGRRDLGNTKRGDGRKYKGRGPIQITGRFNYIKYGKLLGIDLESDPEQAATPEIGSEIAAAFWSENNLNEWADKDDVRRITRRINGGYNGLESRMEMLERAKKYLVPANDLPSRPVKKEESPLPSKPVEKEPVVKQTPPLPIFVQKDLNEQ